MRERLAVIGLVLALSMAPAFGQDETEAQDNQESGAETEAAEDQDDESGGEQRRRGVRRLGDVVGEGGEEWSMDIPSMDMPAQPVQVQPQVRLPDEEMDTRLQQLLAQRAFAPDDPEVNQQLDELLDQVAGQAEQALADDDLALAFQLAAVLEELDEERPILEEIQAAQDRQEQRDTLLSAGRDALEAGDLLEPEDSSAIAYFNQVLDLDPDDAEGLEGRAAVRDALLERARERIAETDFEGAEGHLEAAREIDPDIEERLAEVGAEIESARSSLIEDTGDAVRAAIEAERLDDAEDEITQLVALGADRDRVETLRAAVSDARVYGSFRPGQEFRDSLEELDTEGPEMVVIPSDTFRMGSPEDERDRAGNEGPRFRVEFERGFALAKTEVTVAQFRQFVEDTDYRSDAERSGGSRTYDADSGRIDRESDIDWRHDYLGEPAGDELPVIHVSWRDADAYAQWLARQTGRSYRLPTEAEFEYALRAGSDSRYWWGDSAPDEALENVTGDGDRSTTRRSWNAAFRNYEDGHWGPAPAGSLAANPFGLHDMGGNVMEWVEDCWHDSYARAPDDGSAWVNPGCERRVLRGADWSSTPAMSRSAFRIASGETSTDARVGFRVARDL